MEINKALSSAVNITRRLPPSKIQQSIAALSTLRPDLEEELYQKVDQPLSKLFVKLF